MCLQIYSICFEIAYCGTFRAVYLTDLVLLFVSQMLCIIALLKIVIYALYLVTYKVALQVTCTYKHE